MKLLKKPSNKDALANKVRLYTSEGGTCENRVCSGGAGNNCTNRTCS